MFVKSRTNLHKFLKRKYIWFFGYGIIKSIARLEIIMKLKMLTIWELKSEGRMWLSVNCPGEGGAG